MFTGLIESVGRVGSLTPTSRGVRMQIRTELAPELSLGDSLATNGVCLTVVDKTPHDVAMDVSPETLRVTTLGDLETGSLVNLERPMRADGRFGGHIVQGHVDATGLISAIEPEGEFYRLVVAYPAALAAYFHSQRLGRRGRDQPDHCGFRRRQLRYTNHPAHLDPYEPVGRRPRHPGEPGVRSRGKICDAGRGPCQLSGPAARDPRLRSF